MDFSENTPIYKQIFDRFCSQIINQKWKEEERIPSVREVAVLMEVNPNTAIRAFHELQEKGIIYNKRGLGYFVEKNAVELVKKIKREEFIQEKLPILFKDMEQLDFSFADLKAFYDSEIGKKK